MLTVSVTLPFEGKILIKIIDNDQISVALSIVISFQTLDDEFLKSLNNYNFSK